MMVYTIQKRVGFSGFMVEDAMFFALSTFTLLILALFSRASPVHDGDTNTPRIGKRCTGTISSLSDIAAAEYCSTININAFMVPAGQALILSELSDISFH